MLVTLFVWTLFGALWTHFRANLCHITRFAWVMCWNDDM